MPSPLRILELLIYALIGFLPYILLMVYPHRGHLRFSASLAALLAVLAMITHTALTLAAGLGLFGSSILVLLADTAIFVLFFLLAVRAPMGKKLLTMLCILNLSLLILSGAELLEGRFFPVHAPQLYNWPGSLMIMALQLVILVPCGLVWVLMYAPTINRSRTKAPWNFLWLLPGVSFAAGLCLSCLSFSWLTVTCAMAALSAAAGLISYAVIRKSGVQIVTIKSGSKSMHKTEAPAPKTEETASAPQPKSPKPAVQKQPKKAPAFLSNSPKVPSPQKETSSQLQAVQYSNLLERITESGQEQQELRRHIDIMARHLEGKEYEKLRTHIAALQAQLSAGDGVSYCENPAANRILAYFSQQAGYYGTRIQTKASIPDGISMADTDLSVLLGNLLDNALDACKKQKSSDRRIAVAASVTEGVLFLTVENTYEVPARMDGQGHYLSSKRDGRGTGIEVCRQIANRHSGGLDISEANGIFKVSVSLMIG